MDDAEHAVETGGFYLALALSHIPLYVFLAYSILSALERVIGVKRGRPATTPPARGAPFVCVQVPLFNEPSSARRAVDVACLLHWPRDAIEIQILDDSEDGTRTVVDDACAEWRERGVVCNVLRVNKMLRGKARRTKAAALEYGRTRTAADFITVLDADAVPGQDYLEKIIPYFYDERGERRSEIAVVQPSVGFRNAKQNFLTMHQAFKEEAETVVGNRAYVRAFGCVLKAGNGATWSAAALRAVGGWDQSLIALEGYDMSIKTRIAGYRGKTCSDVVVETELPSTLSAYKSQQLRWMWAWAYLAKRHFVSVLFNSFNGISSNISVGFLNGNLARLWFAAALLRPAQWVLFAVWLLVLPELIVEGMWLGNAERVMHGAAFIYIVPILVFLKADTFAVADVERNITSPPTSTGDAVRSMRTTISRITWVVPHAVYSLGMVIVYTIGYARGFLGLTYPDEDSATIYHRTPKVGNVDVEMADIEHEGSCTKFEIRQVVFESLFVLALLRASLELMRWAPTGGSGVGTISFVSLIGFGIVACSTYVAAGSWDDKCGPTNAARYRAAAPEERAGLLKTSTHSNSSSVAAATMSATMAARTALDGTSGSRVYDMSTARGMDFSVGEDEDDENADTFTPLDIPAPATSRDVQKAIRKYKKMRDNDFDMDNYSEYAQSDATSVFSEAQPSHVNFGSYAAPSDDIASDIGSAFDFADHRDDDFASTPTADLDDKDREALERAKRNERETQARAQALRMSHLRVNTAPTADGADGTLAGWNRPPRSPRSRQRSPIAGSDGATGGASSAPTSAENSPRRVHAQHVAPPPPLPVVKTKAVAAEDWIDSPLTPSSSVAVGAPKSAINDTD